MKFLYPGAKPKALTFSYDDGQIFDRRLIEIFNKNGLKATFNLNSCQFTEELDGIREGDYFIRRSEAKELYKGHEIAVHGVKHLNPFNCVGQESLIDFYEDRKVLEDIAGYIVQGSAYPYGSYTDETKNVLNTVGIKYCRTVWATHEFHIPTKFLEWSSTCHHADPRLMELGEQFIKETPYYDLGLMYVWGHSYEFDRANNWEVIEEFAKMMSGKEDIWYATNIEICNYINAVRSIETSLDGKKFHNPTALTIFAKDGDSIVEIKPGETYTSK